MSASTQSCHKRNVRFRPKADISLILRSTCVDVAEPGGLTALSPRLDRLRMSLIDKHLPHYQFSERHRTRVRASPDEVMRAVVNFNPPPDRLRDVLLALRTVPARLLGREAPRAAR